MQNDNTTELTDEERSEFREEVLKTLSFFEHMTMEMILIDMNQDFLLARPSITTKHLHKELFELKKQGRITATNKNKQFLWIRIYPKKAWYKRIWPFKLFN